MISRLVRSYYETNGDFKDIMSSNISRLLIDNNITESDLYGYIGFKDTDTHSAKELYDLRREVLTSQLDVKDLQSKIDILGQEHRPLQRDLFERNEDKLDKYIKLLSKYLMADVNLIRGQKDFRELLNEMINLNQSDLGRTISSKRFLAYYDSITPAWKYSKDCEPCIQMGTFYTCDKLTASEQKHIMQTALKDVVFGSTQVGESYALELRKLITKPITFMSDELYGSVLDLAMKLNITIRDLLLNCNINYIDFMEQWSKYRCLYFVEKNDIRQVCICVYNAKDNLTKLMFITQSQFKYLYEHDILSYLTVINNDIYANKTDLIPLSELIRA